MTGNDSILITVDQAKQIIDKHAKSLMPVALKLEQAAFLTLAEDILAPVDVPAFRQSAMDGYALRFADIGSNQALSVEDEIPAGVNKDVQLRENQTVRIFTGAVMPENADTVVVQEKVTLVDNQVIILDNDLKPGANVRKKGTEISAGSTALKAGEYLSPGAIGFLASLGISEVLVFPRPRIHLIVTGSELQKPGKRLSPGQVYETNSYSLRAALLKLHFSEVTVDFAADDLEVLERTLRPALRCADVVLFTGGVSMGDYDFVIESARRCGVVQLFHKIKQKPGKPMYFGMKNHIPVFGLPGNPASVLTCFYEYVLPALAGICRQKHLHPSVQYRKLTKGAKKKEGVVYFLKGYFIGEEVHPLEAQESFRLSSFVRANCLICLPASKNEFRPGDMVEIHIIQ